MILFPLSISRPHTMTRGNVERLAVFSKTPLKCSDLKESGARNRKPHFLPALTTSDHRLLASRTSLGSLNQNPPGPLLPLFTAASTSSLI